MSQNSQRKASIPRVINGAVKAGARKKAAMRPPEPMRVKIAVTRQNHGDLKYQKKN